MEFRKFRADKLFDGKTFFSDQHVLISDENGVIKEITAIDNAGENIEFVKGILTPGFINCHTHVELSHLKNVIPPHTGLIEFLCSVVTKRGFDPEIIQQEISAAEKEMFDNGIVAVGDIGNTADTAEVKSKSKIRWQNFVEVLSFTDENAEENLTHYKTISETLEHKLKSSSTPHRTTLVPHAPYSISPKTFELINRVTKDQIISIHNQEHPAEDILYKTGGGDYLKLFKIFDIEKSPFPITGKSSIRSCLPYFDNGQTIFLIHNTFMPEEDVIWANDYASSKGIRLVYCLCINANLYIENKVPPVEMLLRNNCHIVLGTDSYSSNWQLSIAKEIQSAHQHLPNIPLEKILQWATMNGAEALQWEKDLGTFTKGKKPGIVHIDTESWQSKKIL